MTRRGFTLIEVMITVAIIGILSALAVTNYDRFGARNAVSSAANELVSVLSSARTRAMSSGADVWVVFFEDVGNNGVRGTGGDTARNFNGGYAVIEDPSQSFVLDAATVALITPAITSTIRYAGLAELTPATLNSAALTNNYRVSYARLLSRDYSNRMPRFGTYATSPTAVGAPYRVTSTNPTPPASFCTFCTGGKGAVVFDSEGRVRFYDGTGTEVAGYPGQTGAANRAGFLSFISTRTDLTQEGYVIAISGVTGLVNLYSRL